MTKRLKYILPPLLVLSFVLLWEFNYELCDLQYPYAWEKEVVDGVKVNTERGDLQADLWTKLRYKYVATLYLLGLLVAGLPKTRLSRSMLVGAILLIGCGWIDKVLQNVFVSMLRDYMIIWVSAVFVATLVYKRKW